MTQTAPIVERLRREAARKSVLDADKTTLNDAALFIGASLETLENVTAALRNCLAHFGSQMTPADLAQRKGVLAEAENLLPVEDEGE